MPFPSIAETELHKKIYRNQNRLLLQHIRQNNSEQDLKHMQIVRFGNNCIAIHRPPKSTLLNGGRGTIYAAYPIKQDGTIERNEDAELRVKIIKDSSAILKNMAQKKEEYEAIQQEAMNDNHVFSTRMTIIPQPKKKKGKTVYEIMFLMSKVPGDRLDSLLTEGKFAKKALTPEHRIRLALHIVNFYIALHNKGVLHGDIKIENLHIDLDSLQVWGLDIAPCYNKLTAAPEIIASEGSANAISAASDIYAIAQDLLAPIFSGLRPEKDEQGNIPWASIQSLIIQNFNTDPDCTRENFVSQTIHDVLLDMHARAPQDRMLLEDVKDKLQQCLQEIIPSNAYELDETSSEQWQQHQKHQKQLRSLDLILNNPEYNVPLDYAIDLDGGKAVLVQQASANKHRFFHPISNLFSHKHRDVSSPAFKL